MLIQGDVLTEHEKIEDGTVDLILTDLPYGNMDTDGGRKLGIKGWDLIIQPKRIYEIADRILRKNGKMILFGQEPYTSQLINESFPNLPFNYRAIWEKDSFAVPLGAKKNMVSCFEDILVFSKLNTKHDFEGKHPLRDYFKEVLNFIDLNLKQINGHLGHRRAEHAFYVDTTQFSLCTEQTYNELIEAFGIDKMQGFKNFEQLKGIDTEYREKLKKELNEKYPSTFNLWEGNNYKSNILKYKKDYQGHHPTQKPVALLEDLIKTFSNEDDLVVDLTMGSGSTGVACKNTNRKFIGIEKDAKYFQTAKERINNNQLSITDF